MQVLAQLLLVTGILAVIAGFGAGFYVVIYGWKDANPRDHQNPDWLVVLWRLYKRPIIAYFCCVAVGFTALLVAVAIHKHAP